MKIRLRCCECAETPFKEILLCSEWNEEKFEIEENDIYEFVCKNGHENRIMIQNQKYELLFDMGISAFDDGYYREALVDFTASVERFYEFCIEVLIFCDNNHGIKHFETMWKEMRNQSERQYGAFLALYTFAMGEAPPIRDTEDIKFRNKVVHKGYFPSKDDVYGYAQTMAEHMKDIYLSLQNRYEPRFGDYLKIEKLVRSGKTANTMTLPTFLSNYFSKDDFEQAIEEFHKTFDIMYAK